MASLSQGRTAAPQYGLFTYKSVPAIFEPPCNIQSVVAFILLTFQIDGIYDVGYRWIILSHGLCLCATVFYACMQQETTLDIWHIPEYQTAQLKMMKWFFSLEYHFRGVLHLYLLHILVFWFQEFIQNIDEQIASEMPTWMFFIKYMKQEFHVFKFTNSIFLNYLWKIYHVYVYRILYQVRLYAIRQATAKFRIYQTLWGHLSWRITLTWVRDTETVRRTTVIFCKPCNLWTVWLSISCTVFRISQVQMQLILNIIHMYLILISKIN